VDEFRRPVADEGRERRLASLGHPDLDPDPSAFWNANSPFPSVSTASPVPPSRSTRNSMPTGARLHSFGGSSGRSPASTRSGVTAPAGSCSQVTTK
jgi:hypothetical protein